MSDKVKDGGCGEPYNLEVRTTTSPPPHKDTNAAARGSFSAVVLQYWLC
jgi:hypothetical protein